ncbi:hypothetical protein EPO15_16520 [bacterium]|nr:MAG: hypothetical protein EPO15_16520 [bacterium]
MTKNIQTIIQAGAILLTAGWADAGAGPAACALSPYDTAVVAREEARAAAFEEGRYYPPGQVALALRSLQAARLYYDADVCAALTRERFDAAERRVSGALDASLEKDAFVLGPALERFSERFEPLERRVAEAAGAGWPAGSRGALGTEYAGLYPAPDDDLLRTTFGLWLSPEVRRRMDGLAEASPDARSRSAARALVRLAPRVILLERSLGLFNPGRPADGADRRVRSGADDALWSAEAARRAFQESEIPPPPRVRVAPPEPPSAR